MLVILIALNLRPFLTAIGPWPPLASTRGWPSGRYPGLGHPAAPLAYRGRRAAHPGAPGSHGPAPLLGTALLLLALGSAPARRSGERRPAHRQRRPVRAGLGPSAGVLPGLIKEGFAQKVPLVMGIFSACMMGAGRSGPCSPRALPSIWTGLGRWRSGACRCCWPSAGWPGGCPCRPGQHARPHRGAAAAPLPRTWLLIACFGIINSGYGIVVAWLAPAYMAAGWSAQQGASWWPGSPWPRPRAALACPCWQPVGWTAAPGWRWPSPCSWRALAASGSLPQTAPCSGVCCAAPGLGSFSLIMVIALDHLPDLRRAGALCALMQGVGFMVAATGPWVAARLHHASGDFAAAWQWQLGALVLMSLLVVRLNPRHYPGPWACPRSRPWLCRRQATNLPDPASTGLGGQKAQHRPRPVLFIRVREGLALSALLLAPALPWPRFARGGFAPCRARFYLLPLCWQPLPAPPLPAGLFFSKASGPGTLGRPPIS